MVVGFCFALMFLFVPETFWDRTPRPHLKSKRPGLSSLSRIFSHNQNEEKSPLPTGGDGSVDMRRFAIGNSAAGSGRATIAERRQQRNAQHVGFADQAQDAGEMIDEKVPDPGPGSHVSSSTLGRSQTANQLTTQYVQNAPKNTAEDTEEVTSPITLASHTDAARVAPKGEGPQTPGLHNFNSPFYMTMEKPDTDYMKNEHEDSQETPQTPGSVQSDPITFISGGPRYTHYLRTQPPKTYLQTLKPWNGRLRDENWCLVAIRPFILFAYPAVLWSTLVYSLSIGWLIVLSETVSSVYQNKESYKFTALQTGLVYISPFIGGVLGTAVAGKVSDVIVRFMSRRNGGIYEPEFRLVMAIPVTISTCIGLMGFGWSAQEKDNWVVPTVFFGIISFGCALGSTTSITFAVDSYRQYAGEALVTLNFSKSKQNVDRYMLHMLIRGARYLSRPSVLPLFQQVVGGYGAEKYFCGYRRDSIGLLGNNCADVHLRQEGTHVDCEEELDGEVLMIERCIGRYAAWVQLVKLTARRWWYFTGNPGCLHWGGGAGSAWSKSWKEHVLYLKPRFEYLRTSNNDGTSILFSLRVTPCFSTCSVRRKACSVRSTSCGHSGYKKSGLPTCALPSEPKSGISRQLRTTFYARNLEAGDAEAAPMVLRGNQKGLLPTSRPFHRRLHLVSRLFIGSQDLGSHKRFTMRRQCFG